MFFSWTFLALSFLLFHSSQAATNTPASENIFVIKVDPSVKTEELQVRYFMTGEFGGLGGFQVERVAENTILIHTENEGKPARSLKIAFYAPHCNIQTISVDELSQSSREGEFDCTPLNDIKLQGKFSREPTTSDRKLEVQIQYLAFWGHKFFGFGDGAVLTFNVAKSPVEADGSFQAYLPNLAESDGFSTQWEDASFYVLVSDAETGNFLAGLKPPTSLALAGNLKIMPRYPQTIEFDADWRAASSGN
jgi:hypothetical protein